MYSSCPHEGLQDDIQRYAEHKGLRSTVNLALGACAHDGQRELTDMGPYDCHASNNVFLGGGEKDWQSTHGIVYEHTWHHTSTEDT